MQHRPVAQAGLFASCQLYGPVILCAENGSLGRNVV
jgi:hypothetical protein